MFWKQRYRGKKERFSGRFFKGAVFYMSWPKVDNCPIFLYFLVIL